MAERKISTKRHQWDTLARFDFAVRADVAVVTAATAADKTHSIYHIKYVLCTCECE